MSKSEAIAQLVPQTHNVVSEAVAILVGAAVIAFAMYFCFGYAICWIEDKLLTRDVNKNAVR